MKSSLTNCKVCNSDDQLLQLVSIQLLQKAYFRQVMFEGANYFTVFLPSPNWGSYFYTVWTVSKKLCKITFVITLSVFLRHGVCLCT